MLEHKKQHFHCIGIGGIGVSALAELLLAAGHEVSGSDISDSANTQRLQALGIPVMIGHRPENIVGADHIIYSSAIQGSNPELLAAQAQNCSLVSRGRALADFVNTHYDGIAIAGTHGKTTTTSLVAHLLLVAGLDPSYAIGGILNNKNSPVQLGSGRHFVAEVDESDASFLFMLPRYAIVTNIDADHLETYEGRFAKLKESFLQFLAGVSREGIAYLCVDDPVIRELLPQVQCPVITYGFHPSAMVRATHYRQQGLVSEFTVTMPSEQHPIPMRLNFPGEHNVQNALAAIALARQLGIGFEAIHRGLETFPGVGRRFYGHGQMRLAAGSATIIEDYGHHPREIRATLEAARRVWPHRRVVLVFQPHRYSRTRDLYAEFVDVLSQVDKLYLLDIYAAGEQPLSGICSLTLLHEVAAVSRDAPVYVADLSELPGVLHDQLIDQDVVILQGAGSVGSVAKRLMQTP